MRISSAAVSLNVPDEAASAAFAREYLGYEVAMADEGFVSLRHADVGLRIVSVASPNDAPKIDAYLKEHPFPGIVGPLPLPGAGPGNGSISFAITVPPGLTSSVGFKATHQVFVVDPASPTGFVVTNGVEVTLG